MAQTQSALLQVRLDESTKRKADTLFADLGLDTPTAVRIFLAKAIEWEGLPFEVAKPRPNAETLKAMLDGMEILPKRYSSFQEMLDEIDAEIEAEESDELRS
jgi:DNA-damage-inducible protein J